jgi:Ca-activated chloride channel family protein
VRLALAFAALLALAPAGLRAGEEPVFGAGVDVVHLTVSVSDKQGHPVDDLSPDDFVVLEDGRPQKLQLFTSSAGAASGREDLVLDVGLLMDKSESMSEEMSMSQRAAVHFLDSIPRAHDVLTIFFDQDIQISRFDSENQQGLFNRIHSVKAEGQTALYDAITVYLSRVEGGPGRKILVLLTDGEDSNSQITASQLFDMLQASSVIVYPIALTHGMPNGSERLIMSRAFLQHVAELSGGEMFTPIGDKDLTGIYQKILNELSTQYVLGFRSDNPKSDGQFRKLKVQVKRKGLKIRHRSGYYAPTLASGR